MTRIRLDNDTIKYITFFEGVTKARVKDCMPNGEKVTFVVHEGQAGLAIGKNGDNVKRLKVRINKEIEIIEYSEDPVRFVTNLFRPVEIRDANIIKDNDGREIFQATVLKNRILAHAKMRKAKELMTKYYKFANIVFY